MPTGRTPITLQPGTRNPFGQAVTAQEPTTIEATETEESRLRRIIGFIKVGGVSGTPEKRQVLLGSLILKPGDTLQPLIEGQVEVLHVKSIASDFVLLNFVEKDASVEPREVRIPIKMAPRVTQMLYGEATEHLLSAAPKVAHPSSIPALPLKGVQDFIEGSKQADLLNVTIRKVELMGGGKDAEPSKQEN